MRDVIKTQTGTTVSYSRYGSGPPLVLVHGGFSDDVTNWEFVKPMLEEHFTVWAIARRGRGETDPTEGHSLEDEARDVVALIEKAGEPVFLLGHSYGAHCSLVAAALKSDSVRKLILYEPARPELLGNDLMKRLNEFGRVEDWDNFAFTFFHEGLRVPAEDLLQVRASELWPPILQDAKASKGDLYALARYDFTPEEFRSLDIPVLLQTGSESPQDLYVTDALARVLPNARIEVLEGQAHEGMTTGPELYSASVLRFLTAHDAGSRAVADQSEACVLGF
jgi:pimeloyl-ACP methyl ester carboxylesterase